jgi:hypothetical protein
MFLCQIHPACSSASISNLLSLLELEGTAERVYTAYIRKVSVIAARDSSIVALCPSDAALNVYIVL